MTAPTRLPDAVHQSRRDITAAGIAAGLTTDEIAAQCGLALSGYNTWLHRHGRPATADFSPEDPDALAAEIAAADKARTARSAIADRHGYNRAVFAAWAREHVGYAPSSKKRRPPGGSEVVDEPRPGAVAIHCSPQQGAWIVFCPRCQRMFPRRSRHAARRLAAMHDRACPHPKPTKGTRND